MLTARSILDFHLRALPRCSSSAALAILAVLELRGRSMTTSELAAEIHYSTVGAHQVCRELARAGLLRETRCSRSLKGRGTTPARFSLPDL